MQLNKIKFIIMLFPLLLTGCSLNTSIDALLTPPKLSAQQEQIYSALLKLYRSQYQFEIPQIRRESFRLYRRRY